jgi:hypothetical protein
MKQSIINICAIAITLTVAITGGAARALEEPQCIKYTYYADGTAAALACPLVQYDKDKCQIVVKNPYAPYPECCGEPVCENDKPSS